MRKHLVLILILVFNSGINAQVQTTYLWHLHQPTYWGDKSISNPFRSQLLKESQALKLSGQNTYSDGLAHPLNNLEEIFSLPDRVQAYQYKCKNAVSSIMGFPKAGAQITYGGSLLESINSLATTNQWGYQNNWQNNIITAKNWLTSGNQTRLDVVNFTMHHSLSPLISEEVLKKEMEAYKFYAAQTFGSQTSKGYWPAECSFSERIIKTLVNEGVEWSVISNSHLARTLSDYPLVFGTNGCNIDPPNKADKVSNAGLNWHNGQIDGRGGQFAAPFCFTPHKAKYVDPNTGIEYKLDVVPMADLDSYRDGYSQQGIGNIQANIAPYALPGRPSLVLLAHDGDNAWGGGSSYYDEAVPGFTNTSATAGYTPTTIQQYLIDNPVPASDVVHVEDGSWFNAANDWGSPQFINWLWPFYTTSNYEFNPNGWTEDVRNQAVMLAAENHCIMAEQLEGTVQISDIVNPTVTASPAEKAWHFLLPGLDSGNAYYGDALDLEMKATIAANNAVSFAQPTLNANLSTDNTKPSVFIPQRFPYNPGEIGFGPNYGYQQHLNTADFTVWTLAYDVNEIQGAVLKFRTDLDGINAANSNQNETYLGGNEVNSWQTLTMQERIFPKDNITNNPNISFFILPTKIANQYWAKITGISQKLVDYYVEVTDTYGNVKKTDIQHTWVGLNLNINPTVAYTPVNNYSTTSMTVTITATDSADLNPTLYYTTDGTTPNLASNAAVRTVNIPITQTTTFRTFAKDSDGNVSDVSTRTYYIGAIPSFKVYVKPPASWTTVKIYHWNATPTGNLIDSTWPGNAMVAECGGWYGYTFTGITSANLIFNNGSGGAGNQTANLSISESATSTWYDVAAANWGIQVLNPLPPCVMITPAGGNFSLGNTVNVTISATDTDTQNPTIYYTSDGSIPTISAASAMNQIVLPITATTTIKAIAFDSFSNFSGVQSETYTFSTAPVSFTVYFKPPAGWPVPKVYYWNALPTGILANAVWPGVTMTVFGGGWYQYTFIGISAVNIIFNNGSGGVGTNQTGNLTNIIRDFWYDWTLGEVLATPGIAKLENQYLLCPNPTFDIITIASEDRVVEVGIYDSKGSRIACYKINNQQIDLSLFAPGTYILKLITEEKKVVFKQVIKK